MKYWVFQNNQVIGPFDRETISQVAGFSAESLVCPEGRKGTQMGDWQRAGIVPEMAEALLAATRTPVLSRSGAERGAGSMLPPEPTLRDLAVLGSLQERVSQLETSSQKMQDELRAKDVEISRLKVELDHKSRSAADMQTKLADLEVKAYGLASVKDELDRAKEEARVFSLQLQDQQRALEELKEKVSRGTAPAEPAAIPNMAQPAFPAYPMGSAPSGADAPLSSLGASGASEAPLGDALEPPMGAPKPGGMGRLGEFQPPADPFAPPAPEPASVKPPEPLAADPFAVPASSLPPDAANEPLVSLGGGLGASPSSTSGISSIAPPPLVPVNDMAAPSKPRDKRVFIVVGVMAALMVGGVVMLGGKKKKKKAPSTPALTTAPAPVAPPQVGEPALDLTQAAVDFVKGYQIPGRQETVAQLLESRYPTTGRLSPWMVEKIENDKYQVNFWATQSESAAGPKPVFQFQVRVKSKLLQGMNPPAMSLLNGGSLPAPEAAGGVKRSRRRSANLILETPAPARTPRRGRKAAGSGVDAAAAVLEGLKAGAKAAQPPKGKGRAAAKPAEGGPEETQLPPEDPSGGDVQVGGNRGDESDEMLDQLLLPGMDKKTPVKKK